ncbi:MAG: hypothetical protein Q7R81_06845 [Candidatus Peregrinibacteria bacterium]|nr:hypothetical protein [Candidatus Peregrinibacteria bacterium]
MANAESKTWMHEREVIQPGSQAQLALQEQSAGTFFELLGKGAQPLGSPKHGPDGQPVPVKYNNLWEIDAAEQTRRTVERLKAEGKL